MAESLAVLETARRRTDERAPAVYDEWAMRVDLAACYRLCDHFGWTDLVYTHLSARVPGPDHHFLINPFGLGFDEVTASSLVKVDLDGRPVGDTDHDINLAGFVIHGAIHEAREDAKVVLHTHSLGGVAVSTMKCGLMPISQHAQLFFGHVGYHDYEGIAVDADEKKRLVADMGTHPVMILRNHGLLVTGETVPQAFSRLFHLEKACMAQVMALSSGQDINIPDPAVSAKTAAMGMGANSPIGRHEWPSLLRMLDRKDPGYRD